MFATECPPGYAIVWQDSEGESCAYDNPTPGETEQPPPVAPVPAPVAPPVVVAPAPAQPAPAPVTRPAVPVAQPQVVTPADIPEAAPAMAVTVPLFVWVENYSGHWKKVVL